MKERKIVRNLWLFGGFCYLLTFIFNLRAGEEALNLISKGFIGSLCFINAYFNNKRIDTDNED